MNKRIIKKISIGLCFSLSLSFSTCTLSKVEASTDPTKQNIKLVEDYLYKLDQGSVSYTAQLKNSYVTSNTGKRIGNVDTTLLMYDKNNDDLYLKAYSGTKSSIEILERNIHSKKCLTYQLSQNGHKWYITKASSTASKNTEQISTELSLFKKILKNSTGKFNKTNKSLAFTAGQYKSYTYTLEGDKLTRDAEMALNTGETNIKTNIYNIGNSVKIDYKNLKK